MDRSMTFTLREISAASGIKLETLRARYAKAVKEGRARKNETGLYTYDQVKMMFLGPKDGGRKQLRPAYVDVLRRQLQTDGIQAAAARKAVEG